MSLLYLHRWDVIVYEMVKGGKSIYSDPFAFLRENLHPLLGSHKEDSSFSFHMIKVALPDE